MHATERLAKGTEGEHIPGTFQRSWLSTKNEDLKCDDRKTGRYHPEDKRRCCEAARITTGQIL